MMTTLLRVWLLSLLAGVTAWAANPVAWWAFDETKDRQVVDSVSQHVDAIDGQFTVVKGVKGTAIRFDAYTTEIVRVAEKAPRISGGFAVEAHVALGAYPWNWCSLITQRLEQEEGFSVDVGTNGELRLQVMIGDMWQECVTPAQVIPVRQWKHIVASCDPESGVEIFVDGRSVAKLAIHGKTVFAPTMDMKIGANHAIDKPAHIHRDYGTLQAFYGLDGIIDELKLYDEPMTAAQVAAMHVPVTVEPELPPRRLPSGPKGMQRFGAFYENLKYYPEWDALWRVADHPDIVVSFDESPVRVVFWRGTRYSPVWVSGNDLWMADQSVEAWNTRGGCYEHMQDRRCRYSSVRVIESNDARVVVHWRYAPTSASNELWNEDPKTGRACWVDEYYTIYPDVAGVRHVSWMEGTLGYPQQFQESLPLTHPGQYPSEVVEANWVHIANYDGEVGELSYIENPPRKPKPGMPKSPTIQRFNFKSKQKPFICFEPGNQMKYLRDRDIKALRGPGACNHWPVGQAVCDGRTAQAADHPTHFCGFPISAPPKHLHAGRESWQGLYGMTEGDMGALTRLGRSWAMPAAIVATGDVQQAKYVPAERAYGMERAGGDGAIALTLSGSAANPVINPAFVIRNWGESPMQIEVDGKVLTEGPDCRIGLRERLDGTDCIVWLKLDREKKVEIRLRPKA